jgi:hypothetical protein
MKIRNKKTGEIKEVSINELNQYGLGSNMYKSGGEMIKRADGSYSRRGLWDNIRANAGSGKKPTKEMLNQERKIKNQHQAAYGMEIMGNGGVPNNPGFVALPEYVQQNIINNMATGGQKMPPELAYARFAAAGNLDQLNNYGYQIGGEIPTVQGTFKKQNKYGYWVIDEEALAKEAQRLNSKKVLTEGGSLIIFDDNWNIVAADDNPNAPYKEGGEKNKFNTNLKGNAFESFNYHSKLFPSLLNDAFDYDTKGFYKEIYDKYNGDLDAITKALTPNSPTQHIGTDRYKKPNHPTFSNESKYAIPIIRPGGKWGHNEEEDYDYFKATRRNIKNMNNSDGSPFNYFKRAEDYNQDGIPDVKLFFRNEEVFKQGGSVTLNTGGENHRIYVKTTNRGEGAKGHIMVNHPTMNKGMWDTIDLTEKSGATTIAQGVAATKKWHRENPYMKEYGGDVPMYGPGGFVAKPTASDSLAVMNSQIALNKFYDNEIRKGRIKKDDFTFKIKGENYLKNRLKELNNNNLKFYREHIANRQEKNYGIYDDEYKSFFNLNPSDVSKLEYQGLGKTKSSDAYRQYYRDLITPMQNLAAPFALVDSRINPRAEISYQPIGGRISDYPGGSVSVFDYDPIAIKPAAMKTAADWAYMQKTYGVKPPAKNSNTNNRQITNTAKPPVRQTINTTQGKVTGVVRPNQIKGSQLVMMMDPVRTKDNLERLEMVAPTLVNPKIVPRGELLPVPSKQTVNLTNLIQPRTYPIDIYDRRGNFIRQEFMGDSEGVVEPNYIGKHHYAHRGANSYIDTNYANGGSLIKYQDKGEVKKRKWYYPKEEIFDGRPHYDPTTETLYLNPDYNNNPELVKQHELFHHLQKINGGLQRPEYYTGPLKEPNMMMNEDMQGAYWNRKTVDVRNLMNQVIQRVPDFQFFPKDLLYNKVVDNLEYDTPGTMENEAQQYEDYIRSGGTPMFNNGGGIPERYRNMGFTNVGAKKQSTRPGKKWMVLAKKGDNYKVVHGGYKGMQDFKQHHSEQRKENFWNRMGGRNSSKATDPFSPLYWHKRFGTWEYGGQPMAIGGQNMMNPIVKKDNRNWLEYLKN